MPDGFRYARGPKRTSEAIPSSAFSKGDLLMYDSNSSLSRADERFIANADIAGVALADSIDSINDRVPFIIPRSGTLFWASLVSNLGSEATVGTDSDIEFDTANGRYYVNPGSTTTVRAVIRQGTTGVGAVDQSVQSTALVELIGHDGSLEHS